MNHPPRPIVAGSLAGSSNTFSYLCCTTASIVLLKKLCQVSAVPKENAQTFQIDDATGSNASSPWSPVAAAEESGGECKSTPGTGHASSTAAIRLGGGKCLFSPRLFSKSDTMGLTSAGTAHQYDCNRKAVAIGKMGKRFVFLKAR